MATGAEARLYHLIKEEKIGRIRRQVDVGNLIVDLGLPERNLIIEIDGESHSESGDKDTKRDMWLTGIGFRVLRISNEDVFERTQFVLDQVRAYEASEQNRTFFNIGLRVARQKTDLTHTPHFSKRI